MQDPKKSPIVKAVEINLNRFHTEISKWKLSILQFNDAYNPIDFELISRYTDAVLIDNHLKSVMNTRKSKTLSLDYKVVNESGEEDEKATDSIRAQWFRDVIDYTLDSIFWGHTVIKLGSRLVDRTGKTTFEPPCVLRRDYANGRTGMYRESPFSNEGGFSYREGVYKPWTIEVGDPYSAGLLSSAVPMTVYKKAAFGSWADFTELFGNPIRVAKTNTRDDETRDNAHRMLKEMGSTAYGVFDIDDEIEFIQAASTDAFQTFKQTIDTVNNELSKLIVGSTMISDDGSSRSQAEVHERTAAGYEKADAVFIEDFVNNTLFALLEKYHGFNFSGLKFMFDDTEHLGLLERIKIDAEIGKLFDISPEYIRNTYGVDVDPKESSDVVGIEKKEEKEIENRVKIEGAFRRAISKLPNPFKNV